MSLYIVKIKNGKTELAKFEAMGFDSMSVAAQHDELAQMLGGYVFVTPWRSNRG
jgi:hypothetical protein